MAEPPAGLAAEAPAAFILRDLSFAYGPSRVLDGVSFTLPAGSFTALLGHNGAGKSTLFLLALRLLMPKPGAITIGGHDLATRPGPALARIGAVFQEPTLDLDLTVQQNLAYFGALRGLPGRLVRARIAEGLASVGLAEMGERKVRVLSLGQRRRIEIIRAMLHQPALLLLDEPTTGLDIPARAAIVDKVHRLARESGVTVLWATHIIDEVAPEDRAIVLHRGRVLADGPVSELLAAQGAANLGEAFAQLTRSDAARAAPA